MTATDVSELEELANVRLTLAGGDIGSLPDDFSTIKLAEARMEDLASARDEYQELKAQKDRIEAKERNRLKAEGMRDGLMLAGVRMRERGQYVAASELEDEARRLALDLPKETKP